MKEASDLNEKVDVDAYINSVLPEANKFADVASVPPLAPMTKAFITIPNL